MTPEQAEWPSRIVADFLSSFEARGTNREHEFTLTETFAGGTGAAEIKTWAKRHVDAIEAKLEELRADVAEATDKLREDAHAMVAKRIQDVDAFHKLDGELGQGI